jgi:hypothetical protein
MLIIVRVGSFSRDENEGFGALAFEVGALLRGSGCWATHSASSRQAGSLARLPASMTEAPPGHRRRAGQANEEVVAARGMAWATLNLCWSQGVGACLRVVETAGANGKNNLRVF